MNALKYSKIYIHYIQMSYNLRTLLYYKNNIQKIQLQKSPENIQLRRYSQKKAKKKKLK